MIQSRSYSNEEEAREALQGEIDYGKTDPRAGPYTGILWPSSVSITGEIVR